jgi:hypothetical protein
MANEEVTREERGLGVKGCFGPVKDGLLFIGDGHG